jgi:hypothetical protein
MLTTTARSTKTAGRLRQISMISRNLPATLVSGAMPGQRWARTKPACWAASSLLNQTSATVRA